MPSTIQKVNATFDAAVRPRSRDDAERCGIQGCDRVKGHEPPARKMVGSEVVSWEHGQKRRGR